MQQPQVFQFKITLKNSKPPIWRRIQVLDSSTFWDLHVAIQDSMGWEDSHLHSFDILNPKWGETQTIESYPEGEKGVLLSWKAKLKNYISLNNKKFSYTYDFGDNWEHIIVLEKILKPQPDMQYPVCIAGKRACPPEDIGGIWGYEEFLQAIGNPNHPQHQEMLEWVGEGFDSEYFEPEEIVFGNPKERLSYRLS